MRKLLAGLLLGALVFASHSTAVAQKKTAKTKAIQAEQVKLGRAVDFQRDISPILEAKCVACHNVAIDESKLSLEDVKSIFKGGKRGPSVVAKQPDKSLLYQLASRAKGPAMPPLPNKVDALALTPRELGLIRQWILEGATAGSGSKGMEIAWSPLPTTLTPIYAVALSPWARYAAAGRSNQIDVYDIATQKEIGRLIDPALSPVKYEGRPMYPGGAAHRDFVHALAFSPDGNLLASGGYRTVKLWQRQPNARKYQVPGGNALTSLAISADGKTAAIGSADQSIQLFDAATGKTTKKLTGHTAAVTAVVFSADGTKLASSSSDKTVRVWDLAKGSAIRTIAAPAVVNDVTFNKDATQVITADADNILRVWPVTAPKADPKAKKDAKDAAEKPTVEMKGHGKAVTSVALLLPAGSQVVSGSEDGTVRIWTISNGRATRTMNHGAPVTDVAARPDGQAVASAGANGTGKLWQVNNGKQLAELKGSLAAQQKLAGLMEEQAVAKQRYSSAQNAVKTADKNVKDREAAAKKAKDAKAPADKAFAEADKKAKAAAAALKAAKDALAKNTKDNNLKKKVSDAEKAATKADADLKKATDARDAADRAIKLAENSVKQAKEKLDQAKKDETTTAAKQKQVDAEVKAAQDADKTPQKPMRTIAFSADGSTIATAGDSGVVQLWSATDGSPADEIATHKTAVAAAVFGPANTILTASADKTAAAWSTQSSWKLVARLGATEAAPLDLTNSPFVGRVLSLAFSRDGKLLATGGGDPSRSGELLIWDVAKRAVQKEIPDAHSDTILGLAFNWDGTQILSGGADKFAKTFDVATGKLIRSFEGHTHHVLSVSWQADGSTMATAGADNVIKVWNTETGEQRRTISNYSKQVTSLQFIGVGGNIIACSGDPQVRFHRTSNGQPYRSLGGSSEFMYAAAAAHTAPAIIANVNAEASYVVAGGADGVLRVWTGTGQSVKNFEPPKPPAAGDKTQASLNGKAGK